MTTSELLFIRADASPQMGIGHVMRSLALAEVWRTRGGKAIFALATGAQEIQERIRSSNAEVLKITARAGSAEDAAQTIKFVDERKADWLMIDGYHFSLAYLQMLSTSNPRLVIIGDDEETPICDCDIVVDPNLTSRQRYGQLGQRTEILHGPAYALLRREFHKHILYAREVPPVAERILITFGGGDFPNASLDALVALESLNDLTLHITVVLGPSNHNRESLEMAATKSRHNVRLLHNVDNMAEVMASTDLAITAGGGTLYELAFSGVPMLIITIADNQRKAAQAWVDSGAACFAGALNSLDERRLAQLADGLIRNRSLRAQMATEGRRMIDGKGAERVVERMLATQSRRLNERRASH